MTAIAPRCRGERAPTTRSSGSHASCVKREPKIACRYESEPGGEMQVDYGEGALTRDPRTGKYRRPRLFALTLGNSRYTFSQDGLEVVIADVVRTSRRSVSYFGGTARTIRFDNLKEGVIKPDVYDPQLNALYARMLDHYGVYGDALGNGIRDLNPRRHLRIEPLSA